MEVRRLFYAKLSLSVSVSVKENYKQYKQFSVIRLEFDEYYIVIITRVVLVWKISILNTEILLGWNTDHT